MAAPVLMTRAEAGAARALRYQALSDRPRQRSATEPDAGRLPSTWTPASRAAIRLERAASQPDGTERFEGFASVTGQFYRMYDWLGPYDEQVAVGAFEQTLAQSDLDVPLVIDHVSSRRIAKLGNTHSPLELTEVTDGETTGLLSVAPTLQLSDPDSAYIIPKLRSGLIDEMSFRFVIEEGRWSEDFTAFTIQRVNLHRGDVSIVGYGANPLTTGSGLRAVDDGAEKRARDRAIAMSLAGDRRR